MAKKQCATAGCANLSAFATRTRPGWCADCIDAVTVAGGLKPLEPFAKRNTYRLTACLQCGVEAHYRLDYILDCNRRDERVCRACFWRDWVTHGLGRGDSPDLVEIPVSTAREHAESHGYDYLGPLTDPPSRRGPHHVRCRRCGRQSAERLGDIGWGCSCTRHSKSTGQSARRTKAKSRPRELFRDSGADAVAWWDHDRNEPADWATAPTGARRTARWVCPDCQHQFTAKVGDMRKQAQCPLCEEKRRVAWSAEYERLKRTPVASDSVLLAAWADEADPAQVMIGAGLQLRRFRCEEGHYSQVSPSGYQRSGCPICRGIATRRSGSNPRLADQHPEIASQWHPEKNGRKSPATIAHDSKHLVWWLDPHCGHEWQATVRSRDKYQRLRCPECETVLDSLGYQYPTLAAEWFSDNPCTSWHVRPTSSNLDFIPEWICTDNFEHRWTASLASRSAGSSCPECQQSGKSMVELAHYEAATRIFGRAKSGVILRDPAFTGRPSWSADISTTLDDGTLLVIEYDGSYWHADKTGADLVKSRDLLAAGHRVVRLREHPLPPLDITDDSYFEITVHATALDPDTVIRKAADWARQPS